jgi:hypothetical protein
VYELSPSGSGWKFAVIYNFSGGDDGGDPIGPLVMDKTGRLYGATPQYGYGKGLVYRLTRRRGEWKEKVLHKLGRMSDAALPAGGVTFDSDGNLYGTGQEGGEFGDGALFELEHSQGRWKESVPFSFNGSDGFEPVAALVPDGKRGFWGTAVRGGTGSCSGGCGLVFRIVP